MAKIPTEYINSRSGDGYMVNDRWWLGDDPAKDIAAIVTRLEDQQGYLDQQRLVFARLYANQPIQSLYGLGVLRRQSPMDFSASRVTWNLCQAAVDTAAAKIAKNKPRVLFLTSGGDWELQKQAKDLTKYCDGLFYDTELYETGQRIFVDAEVFGTGLVKIFADGAEIKAERTLECEVFVNEAEAINGTPRSMYHRMYMHREVAADSYARGMPKEREAMLAMPGIDLSGELSGVRSDMIALHEAWHLGSNEKADNGKRALICGDVTLAVKPWKKDYFPFVKMTWNPRIVGWRGQGLVEQLVGIQLEINRLSKTIQQVHHLMSVPRVYVERGSKIIKAHINNEIGAIVEYNGTKPQEERGVGAAPELYAERDRQWEKGFEITGISQLSATAQKPAGLDSAVSLREYHDIESERFVIVGQRYEQFFIDCAEIMIDLSRDLYKDNKDLRVKAPGTKLLEEIKWKDVDLREDEYFMKAFPTSTLPTTPAGKLQKVQELFEAGFIDKDTAMGLLDFPDLEQAMSIQMAGAEDARSTIGRIVSTGTYEVPEPYMDLQTAIKLAQSAYLKARADGLPEKRRMLLLQFMDECRELLTPTPPPVDQGSMQPGAPPSGMAPPGPAPGAAPLPNLMPPADPMMGAGPQDMTALPSNVPGLPVTPGGQ